MKNRIYVVEGYHDEARLKALYPDIQTISVGGSQIKQDVIDFLQKNEDKLDIILVFDPDHAGESIRKRLAAKLKNPSHIFVEKDVARSKNGKKIGIEHIKTKVLRERLQYEIRPKAHHNQLVTSDLHALGLTGEQNSQLLRDKIAEHFHIGHCNAKTLLIRLNWLGITKEELENVLYATSS
ncbi:ribonuclease M5 [Acholeplasma equirhinis]|uniref:ribonuclease M5 n=1 Tax=Acholeplasma equirhinis TaxID=555393 RepID=UPI00197A755D|nr:ribonuclease M5 [Acholeplasma equirhinis]MBN3491064.1 ribonuclease M5 [Acholeplasma equirhinis]